MKKLKPTKNDAEMMLNDMPREDLPNQFKNLIAASDARWSVSTHLTRKKRVKAGEIIKTHMNPEFNRWYDSLPKT